MSSKKVCALSVRKLKDGAWEDFRAAWDVKTHGGDHPPFVSNIYHVRSLKDPNVVVSFGLGEAEEAVAQQWMEENAGWEAKRQEAIAKTVDETIVDGIFEVVEELVPASV